MPVVATSARESPEHLEGAAGYIPQGLEAQQFPPVYTGT